ncbi:hypothetical protein GCM10011374_02730 [Kocuria dechangensis]|uniref:Uncharacterized protein n=1 Tax=Kocuria dechangensis TaxID=1176249 RepID=A0A917GFX0_9MICC|nr:hypothetical protein GCM10011374_02730 [Kocuria dechangensis]
MFDAVAVPTSRRGKVFCTISTRSCIDRPSPRPRTPIQAHTCHRAVPALSVESRARPAATTTVPATGIHL